VDCDIKSGATAAFGGWLRDLLAWAALRASVRGGIQPAEATEGDAGRLCRMWQPVLSTAPSVSGTSGEPLTFPS